MNKSTYFIGTLIHLIFLLTSQSTYSQNYFEFKNPTFSFSTPDGWKEHNGNQSLFTYGKYVKVNNGIIGGILVVGRDIYNENLETIWNLNPSDEKVKLENEVLVRNFNFSKETINGLKTVKINFETFIDKNGKRKDLNAVIYKFLVKQNNTEYLIYFNLISEPKDFYSDNNDFLKIISSLNFTSQKTVFNSQKVVRFKNNEYIISKPIEYDYFFNSAFKEMNINEFTKTYCFTEDLAIFDLELLIPKNLDNQPKIHFYTMNALKERIVSKDDFKEYKIFWKEMYKQPYYEELLNYIISDSLLFCNYEFSNTKLMTFSILKDEAQLLSTFVFINAETDSNLTKIISITNYIHINDIVIFIKLTQNYRTYSNIKNIQNMSNIIVSEFLKNNNK